MQPLIDPNHLALYVGDDLGLRNEILAIFEDQLEYWLERLDPAMEDKDWHLASHTLKGASCGVGAWEIGKLSEKSESLVGDIENKSEQRKEMVITLHGLIHSVLKEISAMCDEQAVA